MNVDKVNCSVVFEDFRSSLERCNFYAVDQEMTGVDSPEDPQLGSMTLDELYQISRKVVNRYMAFQFGISMFTRIKSNTYEVKSYNFYLARDSGDFVMSAEATSFLLSNKMNFQMWLSNGMKYRSAQQKLEDDSVRALDMSSPTEQRVADYLVSRIEGWYRSCPREKGDHFIIKSIVNKSIAQMATSALMSREIFVSLIYNEQTAHEGLVDITVRQISPPITSPPQNSQETTQFNKEVGFLNFWKCLVLCKKPVIGHNFWLDIMFMVQMHEAPIPETYGKYKEFVHQLFPFIYDTKTLSQQLDKRNLFKTSHLSCLYKEYCDLNRESADPILFVSPPGHDTYDPKSPNFVSKAHEAGYDSYMTGVVFSIFKDLYNSVDGFYLEQWVNTISAFGSHYYMVIGGKDLLKISSTFIVRFEEEIDLFLARLLLNGGNNDKIGPLDFSLCLETRSERCKNVIVRFMNECVDESSVADRVNTSVKQMSDQILPDDPGTMLFPKVLSVSRFPNTFS
ncbi:putative ribonuclease [Trypanosoma vivax]|nr:putative ribonuclease [Trypanosoma vivax]